MSCGVITPPKREVPEVTESVENISGPGEKKAKEEPVKKGPNKKGGTKDSLRREYSVKFGREEENFLCF